MSASVVDMRAFTRTRAPLTDEQFARKQVREQLHGRCDPSRIAIAEARAERLVRAGGTSLPSCVSRAVVWALNATDDTPTPPRAA